MPVMTTKIPHTYGRRALSPGDRFEAHPDHVRLLTALGRAEVDADAAAVAPKMKGRARQHQPKDA